MVHQQATMVPSLCPRVKLTWKRQFHWPTYSGLHCLVSLHFINFRFLVTHQLPSRPGVSELSVKGQTVNIFGSEAICPLSHNSSALSLEARRVHTQQVRGGMAVAQWNLIYKHGLQAGYGLLAVDGRPLSRLARNLPEGRECVLSSVPLQGLVQCVTHTETCLIHGHGWNN